jgi:hypothetical protein
MSGKEMNVKQIKAISALLNSSIEEYTIGYKLIYNFEEFQGHSDQSFYEILIMTLRDVYNYYQGRLQEMHSVASMTLSDDDPFGMFIARKLVAD